MTAQWELICHFSISFSLSSCVLQITAETAYDMVSPGPSVRRRINRKGKRKRIHPPQVRREKNITNC